MVERMAKEVDSPKPFDMLHYTAQCTLEMVCASSLKSDITDDPHAQDVCGENEEQFRKPLVFLDQLLNTKRGDEDLAMQEIENHIYTIIGAGSETSANQVAYILLQLAMHPDIQDRVCEEIRSIYGDSSLNISFETISAQNYLEQVIKETLRLFPVAPLVGRETIETVKLGDVVIPPGVTLLMNIMHVHRSKELWGDRANVFDPDRFDPATYDARQQHPFSYIPFGGGPRNCIGYRYVLSTPLSVNDSLKLSFAVTLKTGVGHQICIKRRTKDSL
ncbi:cytochrome P450 4C1-like [Anopheles moucheti]|uniref:cytochrome P450 4C1-like n=1 Tax=Anopheles moucheti TaxID=186751 RepID=UPI0022F11C51|nr:cytochrome P450 4C1-like [Anopheles moucheti]